MSIDTKNITDKIKLLLNRNKQINQRLEEPLQNSEKTAIENEKESNNNEIRKQRVQKYEQEQVKEDLHYMKRTYQYLKKLKLIKSQYQFSKQFLEKSQYYFGMILCEERHPSIDSLHRLIRNIGEIRDLLEEDLNTDSEVRILNNIIAEGQNLITQRLFKYL